jgi:carbon monoxide dehydrogenase subunit G
MQLTSQQTLPVSQTAAWEALNDMSILQACIPGCESLKAVGQDRYEVIVMAAVGPVKARFKGQLSLSDLQPPQSYRIDFEGQGGPAGHGKGSAQVRLESDGASTTLHYSATAAVGGKIAQIGQRLVDMAAQRMASEFFSQFDARLRELHPAPAAPAAMEQPARRGWLETILGWFRRRAHRAS